MNPADDKLFQERVAQTRDLYGTYPDIYRIWSEYKTQKLLPGSGTGAVVWYGEPPVCVQLITKPGTLAWKIVHYETDLPVYDENIEIDGDVIRRDIPFIEMPNYDDEEDIDEDCTAELALLPLLEYDPSIHFAKRAWFKVEITNLIHCKGSPHIVQLLGKTADNQLVFPRYKQDVFRFALLHSHSFIIGFVKKINLLMSGDLSSADPAVVIADLQCFAAAYSAAPELKVDERGWDRSTFSFESDVYSLGVCLREFMLPVFHRSMMMGFDVPPPFKDMYNACTQELPQDRPSLLELRQMALVIEE
ncbi:hypothetical protein B0H10DRAFT_2430392 [Mycena sp. CBHHK59/15]|nr:hypothetical protein B0H10DRAFT_2430392 [Mycena sp. CBHHK59/15]